MFNLNPWWQISRQIEQKHANNVSMTSNNLSECALTIVKINKKNLMTVAGKNERRNEETIPLKCIKIRW